jgi:hypothetical protein
VEGGIKEVWFQTRDTESQCVMWHEIWRGNSSVTSQHWCAASWTNELSFHLFTAVSLSVLNFFYLSNSKVIWFRRSLFVFRTSCCTETLPVFYVSQTSFHFPTRKSSRLCLPDSLVVGWGQRNEGRNNLCHSQSVLTLRKPMQCPLPFLCWPDAEDPLEYPGSQDNCGMASP